MLNKGAFGRGVNNDAARCVSSVDYVDTVLILLSRFSINTTPQN